MSVLSRVLVAWVLAAGLTGCAYVEYRRVYEAHPPFSTTQRASVGEVVERYFIDKGLVLRQRYHDLYPQDLLVSVLEIPRTPGQKRRDPFLFVIVTDGGLLRLVHSEWYLGRPPDDLVADSKPGLLTRIADRVGGSRDLRLAPSGGR